MLDLVSELCLPRAWVANTRVTLQCRRAYSIDRQLIVEAQAAGFAILEEMGTRQQVGGSLEGVVYSLTHTNIQVSDCC